MNLVASEFGLLNGMSVEDAGRLGMVTAGLKLRRRGAIGGMPSGEEAMGVFELLRAERRYAELR